MEKITVNAVFVIELKSKQDWVNKLPQSLPTLARGEEFIFIDSNGNFLTMGADFSAAEEIKTYPVKVYVKYRTFNELVELEKQRALEEIFTPTKF